MSEFAHHLHDVLRRFGPIEVRRMFGGHGVFRDGLMFGLVAGDVLYLKADAVNQPWFEQHSLPRFEYRRQGRTAALSYFRAPDAMMDDAAEAAEWARRSFDAALRAAAARTRARKRAGTPDAASGHQRPPRTPR